MNGLWVITAVFFTLFVLGLPVFAVLLVSAFVGLLLAPQQITLDTLPNALWSGIDHFVLLSLPFFVLMGDLALASGVTKRLVRAVQAFVGAIPGGLAQVSICVNMIMAGMSGSDLADAAATGKLLIPAMRQANYPTGYACAVIASAAMIGPLIPPSVAFLLFASVTNESVGRLFLAGAVPGVLLGITLMIQVYFAARIHGFRTEPRVPYRERAVIALQSLPVLVIPFVVLGSFFGGIATPTEAAIVGVVCVLFIAVIIYRSLTISEIREQLVSTAQTVGAIFVIIAASAVFGRVLTLYGAADSLATWVVSKTSDPLVFLAGINLLYLLMGCLIDTVPIILVFVPLIMPTVHKLGIDPIHFGVITVFNLLIGLVTPPYGLTMFLLCRLGNIGMLEFLRYIWPFYIVMVVSLVAITAFPQISLWLPNVMMAPSH